MLRQTYSFHEGVHALAGIKSPQECILFAAHCGMLGALLVGVPSWVTPVLADGNGGVGTAEMGLKPTHLVLSREDCGRLLEAVESAGASATIPVQRFPRAAYSCFHTKAVTPYEEFQFLKPDDCGDYELKELLAQSDGKSWLKEQRQRWNAWQLPDGPINVGIDDLMVEAYSFQKRFQVGLEQFDGITCDTLVDVGGYFESDDFELIRGLAAEMWCDVLLPVDQQPEPMGRDEQTEFHEQIRITLRSEGFTARVADDAVALMRPKNPAVTHQGSRSFNPGPTIP